MAPPNDAMTSGRSVSKFDLALTVIAAPSARRFYESCGFSVEGETQTRFGAALKMSR